MNNIKTNFVNHRIEKYYQREGKKCIFDPIREILVIATPEEIVRQKIIQSLIKDFCIPTNKIEVEVPLSHFQKGKKGRADIVLYGENSECENIPVAVLECKAPNTALTDEVWDQVLGYENFLGSGFIIISNGEETYAASYSESEDCYVPVDEIPKYHDLVKGSNLKYSETSNEVWKRPRFQREFKTETIDEFLNYCWIGEDTPDSLHNFIINLAGFVQDTRVKFAPFPVSSYRVIEDGDRYSSFGNAAGGSWTGDYRYLIIEDDDCNNQIVSLSILGSMKCIDHPKFGTRKGETYLIVAIDDFEKRHNSLQLKLDKYIKFDNKTYTIWHDGTITLGKSGAGKRNELIDYVKKYEPSLINSEGKVILGRFDFTKEIIWEQKKSQEFIINLIKYALVRDKFRKYKKNSF